jgi:hypothetical protein
MKKIIIALLAAALSAVTFAAAAFAQELNISGEAKSGLFWYKQEDRITEANENTVFHSRDDAGAIGIDKGNLPVPARFRLNMEYLHANMGFKSRLQWEAWSHDRQGPEWKYAFGYGNFFGDQLTVAIGRLGASPWGTGGPEMWRELEESSLGIRTEFKPKFLSVLDGLNVGFVLNGFNGYTDVWPSSKPKTFLHYLGESVIGASYTHDLFLARFAVRLDSEVDASDRGLASNNEGVQIVYRMEEHILRNLLPGLSVWAMGYFYGIGAGEANKDNISANNWLFAEYAPDMFTAQLRFGVDVIKNRTVLHIKPTFYWHFFDKLLTVGAFFWLGQDFGEGKVYPGSLFYFMEVEPKVQVNFSPNSYIAFVYNLRREYVTETQAHIDSNIEPIKQLQWFNMRFGLTF